MVLMRASVPPTGVVSSRHIDSTWCVPLLTISPIHCRCALMPASRNVTFTNVVVNGNPKTPWTTRENCAENPECNCQNKATVNSITGDVTLAWNPQA